MPFVLLCGNNICTLRVGCDELCLSRENAQGNVLLAF